MTSGENKAGAEEIVEFMVDHAPCAATTTERVAG